MYPNLYYFFKDAFGIELGGLKFINSFGFFVALSFIAAAITLTKELKRRESMGWLNSTEATVVVGKGVEWGEVLLNTIFGFLIGYKIIGAFIERETSMTDPQGFILSRQGSMGAGILIAVILGGLKYWQGSKQKLAKPEKRNIRIWPHDRVGDMTILAFLFGFLGAKLFHNFENWSDFVRDPVAALTSFSGLTFYGGLICAGAAIIYYARKHKISIWHLSDAFGPAMMIAYAIGRIGCQVAGDGDWGILNSAYTTNITGKATIAAPGDYEASINRNFTFYQTSLKGVKDIQQPADIPNRAFRAPDWMPVWAVAYSFPHNVINEGVKLNGCNGPYCSTLPVPVFPTSFYETVLGLILFAVLWYMRKRFTRAGQLFGLYLLINGFERFLIEQIRVNTHYKLLGIQLSQAQVIAFVLMILGAVILFGRSLAGKKLVSLRA